MVLTHARVAVIGAGIAGLVISTALREAGAEVAVFEQAAEFSPIGAGLQLSPNGVRVLHALGHTEGLAEKAVRAGSIEIRRWDDGAVLSAVSHGDDCVTTFGAPYYLIHRADLHELLVSRAGERNIHMGHRLERVVECGGGVELRFANGARFGADLVIGADGTHSAVRAAIVCDEPVFSGYSVYRGLIPAGVVPSLATDPRVLFWFGPQRHVTYYPIRSGRTIHFSAVCATADGRPGSSTTGAETAELAAAFADWHPEVRRVVTAARSVTRWGLFDRDLVQRYHAHHAVLVGDAAHPMLPYLSQGANQALEDAAALLDRLGPWLAGQVSLDDSLARYEADRGPRTAEVHRQSRLRGEAFHLADGERQRERDFELAHEQDLDHLAWIYGHDTRAADLELTE
ncbi:FAD-dependent monooxygenase [Actinokineospora terrae]|uniref:Salicylate hydroxylase n=1 Tax=Actinokineospora terrae TaxID=155974 RepID=A0A1H9WJU6_9PSEU|nr:FAD-dependent monooxygenase [Actinokineospora terrae]SES33713.1 salicylate hydroxylase [Actinokineospora terrae]